METELGEPWLTSVLLFSLLVSGCQAPRDMREVASSPRPTQPLLIRCKHTQGEYVPPSAPSKSRPRRFARPLIGPITLPRVIESFASPCFAHERAEASAPPHPLPPCPSPSSYITSVPPSDGKVPLILGAQQLSRIPLPLCQGANSGGHR